MSWDKPTSLGICKHCGECECHKCVCDPNLVRLLQDRDKLLGNLLEELEIIKEDLTLIHDSCMCEEEDVEIFLNECMGRVKKAIKSLE